MNRPPGSKRVRIIGRVPVPTEITPRDVEFEQLLKSVDLASLPPPPSDGPEWRERAAAVERWVPGLSHYMAHAPIGWFPILEHAARQIPGLLASNARLETRQVKEKLAGLRWYAHVVLPSGEWDGTHAALGAVEWSEHVSERVCSLHGTADGVLYESQGWLLTLSPRARQDRREQGMKFSHRLYPAWTDN